MLYLKAKHLTHLFVAPLVAEVKSNEEIIQISRVIGLRSWLLICLLVLIILNIYCLSIFFPHNDIHKINSLFCFNQMN